MRICRFNDNRLGVVLDHEVADVTPALALLGSHDYPLPRHDLLIGNLPRLLPEMEAMVASVPRYALADVRLLSPVANPGKIIGAPVNYVDHLAEATGQAELHHGNTINPIEKAGLFLKATSSLQGCSHGVVLEHLDRRNDHEIELVAVIGKAGRNIARERALEHVAGFAIGLDMTVRGSQDRSMRKSIDTFTVLGPWMVTADEVPDPDNLEFSLSVSGEVRQQANTRQLIMNTSALIAFASSYYTLKPGDLLYTGTPAGVGPVEPGDRIHARIANIGAMDVEVRGRAVQQQAET